MSDVKEPILPAEEPTVKRDKKIRSILMWATIVIAFIVIGTIAYIFMYRQPAIQKGNDAIGQADIAAMFEGNDSTSLAAYEQVAADHGFDAGNRAALQSAIILYKQGEYQKALDYLGDYDVKDAVVGPLALALKGDCLVNLDELSKALKAYDSAISAADKNPSIVPYLLCKKAVVYSEQGKHAEAAKCYKEVETEYPGYAQQTGVEGRRITAEALAEN